MFQPVRIARAAWLLDASRPSKPDVCVDVAAFIPARLLADLRGTLNADNAANVGAGLPPQTWDTFITEALKDRAYAWQRELLRAEAESERD